MPNHSNFTIPTRFSNSGGIPDNLTVSWYLHSCVGKILTSADCKEITNRHHWEMI